MVDFVVLGPFDVAIKSNERGARILEQATEIKKRITEQAGSNKIAGPGCYVFAYSAPRSGAYPIYVGMATKNILNEALNPSNITKINHFLFDRRKGRMQIFAICQRKVKLFQGNAKVIAEIEDFLIAYAALRNRNLLNIHGNSGARWSIAGVANTTAGNPGTAASAFKAMMGMKSRESKARVLDADVITPEAIETETPEVADIKIIDAESRNDVDQN